MGKISRAEFNQLAAAAADLENLPLFIDDTAWPDDRRAAHPRCGGCSGGTTTKSGLVVVDYLQLLTRLWQDLPGR